MLDQLGPPEAVLGRIAARLRQVPLQKVARGLAWLAGAAFTVLWVRYVVAFGLDRTTSVADATVSVVASASALYSVLLGDVARTRAVATFQRQPLPTFLEEYFARDSRAIRVLFWLAIIIAFRDPIIDLLA